MKNQKGITLIALVITIIVLLILAAVTIAMLTGKNGILTKATESASKTTEAEEFESVKLALAEIIANKLAEEDSLNVIDKTNIETIITRDNSNINVSDLNLQDEESEVTFTVGAKNYTIDTETGKITEQ